MQVASKKGYLDLRFFSQIGDDDVCLVEENACIFKYLQQLLVVGSSANRQERLKRIWEPTYT